jgi:hypothetical protein
MTLVRHNDRVALIDAGLWKHATRDVHFSLALDDFGVKYVGKENAQHLVDALASLY